MNNHNGGSIALVFVGLLFVLAGVGDALRGLRTGVFYGKGYEELRADRPTNFWLSFVARLLVAVIGVAVVWKGLALTGC
jgi:hypothetical protein